MKISNQIQELLEKNIKPETALHIKRLIVDLIGKRDLEVLGEQEELEFFSETITYRKDDPDPYFLGKRDVKSDIAKKMTETL